MWLEILTFKKNSGLTYLRWAVGRITGEVRRQTVSSSDMQHFLAPECVISLYFISSHLQISFFLTVLREMGKSLCIINALCSDTVFLCTWCLKLWNQSLHIQLIKQYRLNDIHQLYYVWYFIVEKSSWTLFTATLSHR